MQFINGTYSCHHTSDVPSSDGFHRHMHNGYEILYFMSGDAEYVIESSVYNLKPRDLLLIHPRSFHYLKPLTDAVYERFVIHFPVEKIPLSCLEFIENAKEIYRIPADSSIDRLFSSWKDAEEIFSKEELGEFLHPIVSHVILHLRHFTEETEAKPVRVNQTLEKILRYIDEHPTKQIKVSDLAAEFFVSASWLTHIFRQDLGVSLGQYIEKKRILCAEAYILAGKLPTDTAKIFGYDAYSTFYRQYKKILGKTPKKVEKRLR